MFYIGIDIAKKNHEASIIDSNGKLLDKSISFSNSQVGCAKLVCMLDKVQSDSSANEIQEFSSNTFGVNFAKDAFAFQIK